MRCEFGIQDMADLNSAISDYSNNTVMRLSQPQKDYCPQGWEWSENLCKDYKGPNNYWWDRGYDELRDFNVHMVKQHWGSTSAGWGGMGGAAMTQTYTVVITSNLDTMAVYYQGKLSYVLDMKVHGIKVDPLAPPPYSTVKGWDKGVIYLHKHSWELKEEKKIKTVSNEKGVKKSGIT